MDEVLIGGPERRAIVIQDYDPGWPAKFEGAAGYELEAILARAEA